MTSNAPSPSINVIMGIVMILLGIITFITTYKYVIPSGSIFLIFAGIFLILIRNYGRI